ncbi:hypothetical protein OPKNFCMD_1019 [Methylobacterium crusticola]|uniref:Uncharacterized protein n=1 Tax=Methylobacterium crusticola TaxID=1697972 RepID=A0ABQ4QSZ4_9HYPH|nr:hypothetical protein [Methylobacterium crusticola]GJD48302.1 hypothetical protein OPKNFCMD_1019 [Methylobacterium crusticola]
MKTMLAGAILAATVISAVPASAQIVDIGPGGPSIDLRSRGQRERDYQRAEMRRDRDFDRRPMYREERYREDRGYGRRRDYGY